MLISNWPWSKRVPLNPSRTNMPFKKHWSESSDPTVTPDPLCSLWKRQKLKIWILFLQWSKCIPINLKGTLKTFNGKFEGVYIPCSSQMWRNYHFWPKTAIWCILTMAKTKFKFSIFAFSIGYIRGLRWQWGLKTNFKFFLKGIFVQGSSGTRFNHGQFEIRTFPIYAPP